MLKLLGFGGGAPMVCGDVRGSGEKWMIEKSVTLCCVCLCKDNKDKTQVNPKNCQTLFLAGPPLVKVSSSYSCAPKCFV